MRTISFLRSLKIYWGSENVNAEDISKRMANGEVDESGENDILEMLLAGEIADEKY